MQSNYFELFKLPVSLTVKREDIRTRYIELSKMYHPDFFVNKEEDLQENALEMSALLNKAFKTLSNQDETIAYVLKLKGVLQDNEKYELPPDFLMEMLEVNESLAAAMLEEDGVQKHAIEKQLEELENDIYEPVQKIIENYREDTGSEKELLQVKDYYFKKKYLKRLFQQLNRKL